LDPLELVRQYGQGDLIACSVLQQGMECFKTSYGAWFYRKVHGLEVTLGGPLCAKQDRHELTRRFLSVAKKPVLCYLKQDFLSELGGLFTVGMGVDRVVSLPELLANPGKELKGALKKAEKASLRVEECRGEWPVEALQRINQSYLKHAECKVEMSFLNCPMHYQRDRLRRLFLLSQQKEGLFGFAVLNPIYQQGVVTSYLLDILRFAPTRLWGVWYSVIYRLAQQLHQESYGMNLGFCPLYKLEPGNSRRLNWQVRQLERFLGEAQYLKLLRTRKSQIQGKDEPRYLATFSTMAFWSFLGIVEASGVRLKSLIGPDLWRVMQAGWQK
jgi:lysylphosphatidylglycerol synthetase-like protein (DUF2156 family)